MKANIISALPIMMNPIASSNTSLVSRVAAILETVAYPNEQTFSTFGLVSSTTKLNADSFVFNS
ncbi:hypothetical protein [Legionella birminghamensis]|uniref:hypothetical protein n=1 Tax=Legionella birminghamensis TaxID=28083 RepID=UPI00072FA5B5|nr:hypothetical protein [Legionella birminghamensis]